MLYVVTLGGLIALLFLTKRVRARKRFESISNTLLGIIKTDTLRWFNATGAIQGDKGRLLVDVTKWDILVKGKTIEVHAPFVGFGHKDHFCILFERFPIHGEYIDLCPLLKVRSGLENGKK